MQVSPDHQFLCWVTSVSGWVRWEVRQKRPKKQKKMTGIEGGNGRELSSWRLGSALGEKGKKKLASEANREVAWGGERGGGAFPLPRPPLGSLRSPIFFLFDPIFCLFSPLRSLAPGQVGRRSKSVSFLWVVTSMRWPCLLHPYTSVERGRKEHGTKAPVSWTLWLVPSRH